jgi:serine/threonine-protein kinase
MTGEFIMPEGLAPTPAASDEMIRKLKDSFGKHYELGHLIGRGGFAEVFQVRDLWLKRDLALKAIRPDLVVSETLLARFRREAEAVAALRHPSIVPIYDIGEAEGIMYILMPLIKGESLKQLLLRDGRRPISEARRILLEAASALASAHEAGVVHRDIKPENIMLEGKARRVLVMDFGIAKVMDAAGDGTLTTSGTIVGTPHYMSPEQASGDPHLDHRTDQYSLAVVGYHMLTGSVPFEGENTRAILFKQMMESPRSMRELVPEVPEALMTAVSRGMAKEPAARFPDMEGLAAAIEAATDSRAIPAAGASPTARKPSRVPAMLAGAALLTAAAIVIALVRRPPAAETTTATAPGLTGQPAVQPAESTAAPAGAAGVNAVPPAPAPPPNPPTTERRSATETKKSLPAGSSGTNAQRAASPLPAAPSAPPKSALGCASAAEGEDRDLAFRVCNDEAQKGNVVSGRRLAALYDRSPVPGHDAEAVTWYRKAADAGDLPSLLRLGQLLHLGKGVPQNELDASAKIRQAAEAEYPPAWTVLAERYEQGLGVKKSDKDAAFWYRKAAEKSDPVAQAKVGDFYMRGKGFDKDETEAVSWFRKGAEKGNRDAQYGLGMAYLKGKGVQKSDSLAAEWLKKAATQGHAEAQKEVAKRKT